MRAPRLLLSAPASGCGKTTVTCALLQALADRGADPVSFKSGPDYIDPMFHTAVMGVPARNLDLFLCEEENGTGSFILCRRAADLDRAIREHKIAVLAALSGGKALEGKSNFQALANLRSLYRAGLRAVQLTGNGRNRLADGCGQHRTMGKLTDFGVAVVREADPSQIKLSWWQAFSVAMLDLSKRNGWSST